jgi:GH24 family phage-related lysozyme (muramidase)
LPESRRGPFRRPIPSSAKRANPAQRSLLKHIARPLNQAQFDAVASIIWNGGNFDDPTDNGDSSLYRLGDLTRNVSREAREATSG